MERVRFLPSQLPPRRPGKCVRPGCERDSGSDAYLCAEHAEEQVFLQAEEERLRFVAFRSRGIARSRETMPEHMRGTTLDDARLLTMLSPDTWKRNPRHAAARAARIVELARSTPSFVVRGPSSAGGSALACAALGSVLAAYGGAAQGSDEAARGNLAAYVAAGALVRARIGLREGEPPEVEAFARAGFLVLDGLGTETRADRLVDLLDERLRSGLPFVVVTGLTREEARHRYGDVGESLFSLPVLDLGLSMSSVPTTYAWAHLDAEQLPARLGPRVGNARPEGTALLDEGRAVVAAILRGDGHPTVMLVGPAGAGKTSLAVAMGTALVEADPLRTFLFVDAYELQDTDRPRSFNATSAEDPTLVSARTCDVLVLDEVGVEKRSPNRAPVCADVIHHRHKAGLVTLLTTPFTSKYLKKFYGDGVFRRIASRASFLKLGEPVEETPEMSLL